MCRHTQHCTVGVAKNDMAAAGLAECYIVSLCHRLATLDSPISRIYLHFSKDLSSLRRDKLDTAGDTMRQVVNSVIQRFELSCGFSRLLAGHRLDLLHLRAVPAGKDARSGFPRETGISGDDQ